MASRCSSSDTPRSPWRAVDTRIYPRYVFTFRWMIRLTAFSHSSYVRAGKLSKLGNAPSLPDRVRDARKHTRPAQHTDAGSRAPPPIRRATNSGTASRDPGDLWNPVG